MLFVLRAGAEPGPGPHDQRSRAAKLAGDEAGGEGAVVVSHQYSPAGLSLAELNLPADGLPYQSESLGLVNPMRPRPVPLIGTGGHAAVSRLSARDFHLGLGQRCPGLP
jgi:hypothetical protein